LALSQEVPLAIATLTSICRYSTTWLARALPEDGTVTTLEVDPQCIERATENLTTAGLIHKVNIILGPAAETIETLSPVPTPFDLVFVDADKEGNATYFKHAKRLVRKGGVIVCISPLYYCQHVESH
jgi:predicted O-methyltransferase YrrM